MSLLLHISAIDGPVVLHLLGGYADEAGKAAKLTTKILK